MSHGKIGDCHEDISKYMNEIRVIERKMKRQKGRSK